MAQHKGHKDVRYCELVRGHVAAADEPALTIREHAVYPAHRELAEPIVWNPGRRSLGLHASDDECRHVRSGETNRTGERAREITCRGAKRHV